MEDKLKEYANKKNKIKLLELELDELKKEIEPEIPEDGLVTEFGKFYFTKKKSWTYSGAVEELETLVKKKKEEEIAYDIAKCTESKILTFKS